MEDTEREKVLEDILQGVDDNVQAQDALNQSTLEQFIRAMKIPTNIKGEQTQPFQWQYGLEEFKETFSKTKESTSYGPSGLHMSHWKASLERECISELHAFFIWAAFQFSFVYKRWEVSWHVVLKKKKFPFSQKLRIIQLFKADFNGGLKYLMGRKLMWHATTEGILDSDTYGSRIGKTAPEAVLNLQMIFDDSRLWKKTKAMLFNDADGCYDRIAPVLGEIAVRRLGCPASIANTVTKTLHKMKHHIKISMGILLGYISFSKENKTVIENGMIMLLAGLIGGSGQGSGASPIIWLAILLIMIKVYKMTNSGVSIKNLVNKTIIQYFILSYVDDNTIMKTFDEKDSVEEILNSMKKSLLEWNHLLQITGGALSLPKCKVSILQWKKNYWGLKQPILDSDDKTIKITAESNGGRLEALERLGPNKAEQVLGLRLPMTGAMDSEYKYRKKQIENMALKLYQALISQKEAFLIYQTRYRLTISYCLPITVFSEEELHSIQKKFIFLLLPKMGLNRHTP